MAENPQLFGNGMLVPFYGEMFVLARDGVEFHVDKIPSYVPSLLLLLRVSFPVSAAARRIELRCWGFDGDRARDRGVLDGGN
ncbi:Os09g0512900 [Oryza sativa Japonica Group]|jgi:hypothetical protein|uniref:Os09g0512900 protein n=1 Tax=Oryza sativa subsp. japonica TaxID=39947 RepID=A0A0P0XP41_ORYSJ|nr:hypothetical protein EE612_048896 [Oryza sativa]BAT08927.1 Os09g0512900 [Oryza sativa Japonica Group]